MTKNIVFSLALLVGILFTSNSCTDLDEIILDETSATGLSDKQAADGNLAPVYAALPSLFQHTTYFALQEISTDEAILPYRGGTDWGDNGIFIALHTHTITSADPNVRNTWTILLTGISRSVTAINALATNPDPIAKTYLAEARGMRAYYNLVLLDLFGLVFVKNDLGEVSTILRGTEAVNFLRDEFLAVEPDLLTNVGPGRLTKAGVWGLLARLHLNSAVYRDPYAATFDVKADDMDKVIDYTTRIISAGQHQLVADYFSIFNMDNHTNKELVFAVDQRAELNGHNRLAYFSLSGDQFPLATFPGANGTDGPAITPDFYRTWVDAYGAVDPAEADPRFYRQNWTIPADSCIDGASFNMNRGILRGQQYGFVRVNGAFVKCADGKLKVGKLYNTTRNKPTLPVNFTEQVDFTVPGSNYSTGYRVLKYEFSKKSASGRNLGDVDLPIVRLADVYLMRAEAKLRKGDAAGALADVNAIRAARTFSKPAPALTSMNLDLLFRERGFELYWELQRRTDMIRFGKYEGIWTEKSNTDKFKRLFPIPQTAIDGASNIPGYLKQNQSY
ncbi:MAG: RagB/SusD family nutrient uptake outer membrane protein [Haliscomenobacter sp.]|uniref:RagB/SusD family nutrient uptake outer membrane protein n=1 Tax=Haliscomenobacter sp. TaxID=2717303 RepID=UPI0029B3F657|nr:RagB/SusD family nutrient uptake outer membrane protein [Haliscomenobacter sp.]MDX2071436.1 RagB/SusD family nutrient uptake outer membrane protein [Haliscomenobacter sp.]